MTIGQTLLVETLAAGYAAGVLPPALAMLVETQAALRPDVARNIAVADAAAGALLEAEDAAPLAPEALERVFARLAGVTPDAPAASLARPAQGAFADDLAALPEPLRSAALAALSRHGWKNAARGIRSLALDMPGAAKAEILRIEPHAAAPEHTHEGSEFTLVLTGAFHDGRGVYRAGDVAYADASVTHRPTGEAGPICYSLAVTDAPLAFTGALGVMQKIWKH